MLKKIRYRLVFNRARRLNNRGEGLVQIECAQDKRRIYFSTNIYVKPEQFRNGSVIGNEGLNYALYKMQHDIEAVELEFIKKGTEVKLPMLKEAVRCHLSPAATLMDFGIEVIRQSDRKELTKANYQTLLNNIERFRKGTVITDIDYNFLVNYDRWLREQNIMHNTRISRLRLLRALLNEAHKRDIISENPFNRFRIQQMVAKKGYVPREKVKQLENIKLKGREDIVRDAFLFACYSGLRFSDIATLRKEHFKDGWIVKKMIKTGHIVEIPIAQMFGGRAMRIVEKYNDDIGKLTKQLGTNQSVNKSLRNVFDRVEIDAKITFHSSRHTCATLLGQAGVDISVVQKILGHTKMETTQIYREVDRKTILLSFNNSSTNSTQTMAKCV